MHAYLIGKAVNEVFDREAEAVRQKQLAEERAAEAQALADKEAANAAAAREAARAVDRFAESQASGELLPEATDRAQDVEQEQRSKQSKLSFAGETATERTADGAQDGLATTRADAQAVNVQDEAINKADLDRTMTQGTARGSHGPSHAHSEAHKRETRAEIHEAAGLTWRHQWLAKKMTAAEAKKERQAINKHEVQPRSSRIKPAKRNLETFEAILGETSDGGQSPR